MDVFCLIFQHIFKMSTGGLFQSFDTHILNISNLHHAQTFERSQALEAKFELVGVKEAPVGSPA
jgi:hypothetical protein